MTSEDQTITKKNVTSREQAATSREQAATSREQAATSKEQATTSKEQAATSRKQAMTSEEQATITKEQVAISREQNMTSEEWTTTSNEQSITREIGIQVGGQTTGEKASEIALQDLKSDIYWLKKQLEMKTIEIQDLQEQLDHAYNYVVESWERNLKTNKINHELSEENNAMAYRWATRFDTQAKNINAVIQIAKQERQNVYNDIESLILNKERFSLENLLNYTSKGWLVKRNPVIVNFIETLTHNNSDSNYILEEKLFKRAVAVDAIYRSQHGKYVSEVALAALAVKYSLACSKTIIDIDNHIVSSGSYTKFINWMELLAIEQESLPYELLFLAFDNEQRGQYNYLDCGYNTVIYYTVTNFIILI